MLVSNVECFEICNICLFFVALIVLGLLLRIFRTSVVRQIYLDLDEVVHNKTDYRSKLQNILDAHTKF